MMSEERDALSLTDDDDDDIEDDGNKSILQGILSKWTNYIHGWQDRFIVLKNGMLSYYKSENDTAFGCRGAISLQKASLTPHEFDECRFDVSVNDCLWYLRAEDEETRQTWIDAIEIHKQAESGYGSENSLRRQGSIMSLTSAASLSTTSASSFKRGRGLREKLAEMETFRDILCRQVDTLQNYFDACSEAIDDEGIHEGDHDDIDDVDDFDSPVPLTRIDARETISRKLQENHKDHKDLHSIFQSHGAQAIDFKGESYTFKATTAGILATLSHCIELMSQREDAWKKRVEREIEKRKRVEDLYRASINDRTKPLVLGGPDYEEGPHSVMNEDEFFDAVDATLDKIDQETDRKILQLTKPKVIKPPQTSLSPVHPLYQEIQDVVSGHMQFTDFDLTSFEAADWQLIAEETDLCVYRRELEEDGMIVDPLKIVFTMKGVTGHEVCQQFWDVNYRTEWEGTLESMKVIEWVSEDTVITYQTHKRIWPSTQRDSLFWSHICKKQCEHEDDSDTWLVCNYTTNHVDVPPNNKFVRVKFNIAMLATTIIDPPADGSEITRDNLTCKLQYSANVNPGGWAPATVLRAVAKREYPKFIKRFTQYVRDRLDNAPIMF
ncbi:ceramide transfer protein-like [Tubulanus polymorphus]|uniref:ceramide transfer protein-like n=1 Tax=Tubulanus polymorphus TaxID=672921 RepID=UPI003DA52878